MTLSLAACGGETNNPSETSQPSETGEPVESSKPSESVTLVDVTTEQGISLKLPSDMTIQENLAYVNTETGDAAVIMASAIGGNPISEWKEETVLETYQLKYDDVAVKSFENGIQINGKESLVSTVTLKTPKGSPLTLVLVMLTDGNKNYVINFSYGSGNTEGSLAKNIESCIDSINIK